MSLEAAKQLRHAPGDSSKAHEPDGRAGELPPEELLLRRPLAPADQRVGLCDSPSGCQHQRDRELRGGVGEDVRRVGGPHSSLADRLDVDVVVADGEVGDDLQGAARGVEEPSIDADARVGHDRHGAGHMFMQPAPLWSASAGLDDESLAQQLEAYSRQRANDNHSRSGRHLVAGKLRRRRRSGSRCCLRLSRGSVRFALPPDSGGSRSGDTGTSRRASTCARRRA